MSKKVLGKAELKGIMYIEFQRGKLGLNPLCVSCGRAMRTKRKDRYSAEYYCICNPDLILAVG